jgi:hypothetical protein
MLWSISGADKSCYPRAITTSGSATSEKNGVSWHATARGSLAAYATGRGTIGSSESSLLTKIERRFLMSVKGQIKEGAGFVKEEAYEHGKSPESQKKAQEGRDLRNEGRIEDGKAPKTTKPGTGH